MERIVTPEQMRICEASSAKLGVSLGRLMHNAGKYLAEKIMLLYDQLNYSNDIIILSGSGNNGGDGLICANVLHEGKMNVRVILTDGRPKTQLAINAFNMMSEEIPVFDLEDISSEDIFSQASIIVDCIFGTGCHGELPCDMNSLLAAAEKSTALKIACDIPSGASALNGSCSKNTIKCDYTFTFGAVKTGMLLYPAREKCGQIIVCDINIPKQAYLDISHPVILMDNEQVKNRISKRIPDSHKGDFGKLLCICGSQQFTGAAALSTLAALRSGVGLCSLAAPRSVVNSLSSTIFEAVYLPLDEDENGQIRKSSFSAIYKAIENSTAILIGCGLGRSDDITELVSEVIKKAECPIIIDADGINSIADRIDLFRNTKASIILTPHYVELSRLLGISKKEAMDNRVSVIMDFAKQNNVTLVSKGAGTVIASPDGTLAISISGNAGLSRGGSGDVLSGIIAAFAAQGLSAMDAASCGVYLHGSAADRVSQKYSMLGMLPTDVINELPLLFHSLDR